MYIQKIDFSQAIFREIRETISRYSDSLLTQCSLRAEEEVRSRLAARYDIGQELSKTGDNRNAMLVGLTVDIAIYYMYKTQESIPNIRVKAYDDAVAILKDLASGLASLSNIPLAATDGEAVVAGTIAFGSRIQRNNDM